jgi:hypothetical protein
MTLRKAWSLYAFSLVIALFVFTPALNLLAWSLSLLGVRSSYNLGGPLILVALALHVALGVYLARRLLRELVAWHFLSTLADVSSAKLTYVLFWPLLYPVLLIRLAIAKHL